MSSGSADYVPPKTSARLIAIVVGLLIVTNVITAVGVYYGAAPPKTTESITVIGPWTASEQTKFLPVLDAFTSATGIRVTYSYARQEDLQLILPVQFAAHRAPGDVVFMVSSFIKKEGLNGTVLDLTNVVDKAAYGTGALDPVTGTDGKLYGAAYTGKVKPGFWYRQSFFTAHSLTPPTTWAEFQSLLTAIKAVPGIVNPIVSGDGVGWPLSDVVEHFIATFGGASMHRNLTAGTQKWNSTAVHDLFANRIVPLLAARDFSQPLTWDSTAINGWWNNQYALYFMGSWITGMTPPVDPNDLGVFPLPTQSGITPGIVFGPDFMFIPAYSAKPREQGRTDGAGQAGRSPCDRAGGSGQRIPSRGREGGADFGRQGGAARLGRHERRRVPDQLLEPAQGPLDEPEPGGGSKLDPGRDPVESIVGGEWARRAP